MMSARATTFALTLCMTLTGCHNLREQLSRGRDSIGKAVAAPTPPPGSEFAHAQPVSAPVPPPPPPLPTEPPVQPPRADQFAGATPTLPDGKPTVPPPDSPILRTGAIDLPEGGAGVELAAFDAGDRKPLRERVRERRDERRGQGPPTQTPPPADDAPKTVAPVAPQLDDCLACRKLLDAANRRYADVPSFDAHLTKREVVHGKQLPQDEIVYRFRKAPLSVFMKVLSPEGQGREVMFVKGQFGGKINLITGKGDTFFGIGIATELEPDSKQATAKSRYRIDEAGFGRTLNGLSAALNPADGSRPSVKSLGLVQRPEMPYALEGVELPITAGEDPTLPKGGVRRVYFDSKPDSPAYLLPILVVTTDAAGREVEYYFFSKLKVPSAWTDANWDPKNLGK